MVSIVAVTSCATGIAHSYMAAEAIEKVAKKNGWKAKVEVQGAMGVEGRLKGKDIDAADVVVLANDVGLTDGDRFDGLDEKTIRMTPHRVIQSPADLAEQIRARLAEKG